MLVAQKTQILSESAADYFYSNLSQKRQGVLTAKQSKILFLRHQGFTQAEIAKELRMSRASVSMIEGRAKSQIQRARLTIQFLDLIQRRHEVQIDPGTRLQQVPMIVLQEADRLKIHLRSNMVEILRLVRKVKPSSIDKDGRLNDKLVLRFNERGKLSLS